MNFQGKDKMDFIIQKINESIEVKQKIVVNKELISAIKRSADVIIDCYRNHNGRVFFAGNGGSAADAQHLAGELVGRFYLERSGLAAEALTTNTSVLTAVGNDYSMDTIFSRQIEANGKPGDVFAGLSTSGNSKNIINAIKACRTKGLIIIGFTGESGGKMADLCDIIIKIPSIDTPRIQESHITIGHIICEIVEREMFNNKRAQYVPSGK
jgi:D-sedoheptulose 7-phosphate isomerase